MVEKEFVPLLLGMALVRLMPVASKKLERILNMVGNAALLVVMVAILVKMGPAFMELSWWLPVAALILAVSSMAGIWFLLTTDRVARRTLALSNANRHVGLALLLAGQFTRAKHALPSLACYAIVVAALMFVYPKFFQRLKDTEAGEAILATEQH
jgi:BASS family bile acid:Na+ symporter